MSSDPWARLGAELDLWREAGRRARFWLRDDDAVEPTPELDRLLALSARHAVPMTLAVIPVDTDERLARHLESHSRINVAVHGWSHDNHAGAGEKKQELGTHRPAAEVLETLKQGLDKLDGLYSSKLAHALVPPWNRIAAGLVPGLDGLGFRALSVFGAEKASPIPLVNTHADIMDWHGARGGRPDESVIADILKRLSEMKASGGTMGLLTHHLVHDAAAWGFIDRLLAFTAGHPGCEWVSLTDIIDARP